jgi:hypothetical protein
MCPHCHQPLIVAGVKFKPPRRNNLRDWKRLYLLYLGGSRYWRRASTVREAKQMLDQAWKNNPIDNFSQKDD